MAMKTSKLVTVCTLQRVIFAVSQQVTTVAAMSIFLNNLKFIILVTPILTEIVYAIQKLGEKSSKRVLI
jgi:hypothetical protein